MVYLRSNEATITQWMPFPLDRLPTKGAFHQTLLTRGGAAASDAVCIARRLIVPSLGISQEKGVSFKNSQRAIFKWMRSIQIDV